MRTEIKLNEKVVLTLNQHWFNLVSPFFWTLVILVLTVFGLNTDYSIPFLILGTVTILWLIYKIVERRNNIWVVTNLRIIDESGVFSINSKESPLDKINNVSYHQSLLGRIFGFGNVQIQTAAEMGSTIHSMVQKPKLLKNTIAKCQDEYRHAQIQEQAKSLASAVGTGAPIKYDVADELTKLFELKQKGIITEQEFIERKTFILRS